MKLLVVKLSSMGDVLHALPTVCELKKQLGAEIHWAVQPEFAKLVRHFSCVDRVVEIPRHGGFSGIFNAIKRIRAEKYDIVVDLQGLLKSALITWVARSRFKIGPSFHREGSYLFYTAVAGKKNKSRHAVEECMDVLDFLELSRPEKPQFPVSFPDGSALISDADAPQIAIAPVSRWETKNWPAEKFADVAAQLVRNKNAEIHIIGGKGDIEIAERIIGKASSALDENLHAKLTNHCGKLSMEESAGLIAKMNVLISNDSGPMHMAAALGVPAIVPFGPTLPERTGPYGSIHKIIRVENCIPCRSRVCAKGDTRCMTAITVDAVYHAADEVLSGGK